jgi:hypothetical protein
MTIACRKKFNNRLSVGMCAIHMPCICEDWNIQNELCLLHVHVSLVLYITMEEHKLRMLLGLKGEE